MDTLSLILTAAAAVLVIFLVIKVLAAPIRLLLKMALNAAIGFGMLFLVNFFGEFIGISLEMNVINALIAGFLGAPGVILLVLLNLLL